MRALIASDPGIFESLQKYYKYLQFYIFVSKLLCTMYASEGVGSAEHRKTPVTHITCQEMTGGENVKC